MTEREAGLILLCTIIAWLFWHASKIYHQHRWTQDTLRKRLSAYTQIYIHMPPAPELHLDQELTTPRQLPNCKIPEDWTRGLKRLDRR